MSGKSIYLGLTRHLSKSGRRNTIARALIKSRVTRVRVPTFLQAVPARTVDLVRRLTEGRVRELVAFRCGHVDRAHEVCSGLPIAVLSISGRADRVLYQGDFRVLVRELYGGYKFLFFFRCRRFLHFVGALFLDFGVEGGGFSAVCRRVIDCRRLLPLLSFSRRLRILAV